MAKYYVDSNGKITTSSYSETKKKKKKNKYSVDEDGRITINEEEEEEDIAPLPSPSVPKTEEKQTDKKQEEDIAPLPDRSSERHTFGKDTPGQNSLTDRFNSKTQTELEKFVTEGETPETLKKDQDDKGLKFFKGGAFSDGFDFLDIVKAPVATAADIATGIVQGLAQMGEGVADLGYYAGEAVSDLFGEGHPVEQWFEDRKESAEWNYVDDAFSNFRMKTGIQRNSLLDRTSQAVTQGIGQAVGTFATAGAGQMAGLGKIGQTILTSGLMFSSSAGGGMSEAHQSGASDEEALIYGAAKGVIDAGTEMIFGALGKGTKAIGVSKGISSLDDQIASALSSKISNRIVKTLVQAGVKASAEGVEELLAGVFGGVAKKLTYMDDESIWQIWEDENLLEQFVVGSLSAGFMQGGDVKTSIKTDSDLITDLNKNEEAVVNKEFEKRVAEAEKNGKKLSPKAKNEIYDDILKGLDKGYISIDTIEEVLGGDSYKTYQDTVSKENALRTEKKAMDDEFQTLNRMKPMEMTGEQTDRREELRAKRKELGLKIAEMDKTSERDFLRRKYKSEVYEIAKGDRLVESYNEAVRRKQFFTADVSKYKGKAKQTIENLINSKSSNNTNRAHEYADSLAKYSEDQDVVFEFTNNEQLKADRENHKLRKNFTADGNQRVFDLKLKNIDNDYQPVVTVNGEVVTDFKVDFKKGTVYFPNAPKGDVTIEYRKVGLINGWRKGNTIVLNTDSPRAWTFTVGHEITHKIEGTKEYDKYRKALIQWAKNKGDYDSRYESRKNLYNDGTDIDGEITADLTGEYILNDFEFVQNLATNHQNVFQWAYNEIKHMLKLVTAGSKEARQLERAKHNFEKAYRAQGNAQNTTDIQHSLRTEAPPKKTEKAYKLMRLVDGKLYPLFIGNNEEVSVGTWYNADSPNLSQLKDLAPGTHLVDMETGEAMTWDEYAAEYVPQKNGKPARSKPNVEDIHWANENGYRFMHIEDKAGGKSEAQMLKKYGDTRAYYNWGVNGSSKTASGEGSASLYALRPGWHFGAVPSMHQIGYGGEAGDTVRLDNQVWTEVEMSADVDYNPEAEANWSGDIPTHIPTDGYYRYATNPTQKKTKKGNTANDATKADWYVAGAFKVNRILSDSEADAVVENYNKANGTNVPLDYRRNNGRVFNAETMSIEDSPQYSLTAEQQEYFKDSVVRDENGNLKVMYHGTSNGGFTVFDTYGSKYGLFGQGSYFTDNKDIGQSYTNKGKGANPQVYEAYLNITNPIDMDAQADPAAWQKAFPDASFPESGTNEDFYRAMEDYFEDDGFLKYEASEMAVGALEDMGYDGITHVGGGKRNGTNSTSHQVYIAFYPEQIKDIGNQSPTSDPDIRYSLTEYTDEEKKAHNDAVLAHFGKTYKWAETGYLLLDGTKLDLSGKHDGAPGGYRTVDHRDITEALGYDYGGGGYSDSLVQFMSEGNIRIIPEVNGINLSVPPTSAQEKALAEYISRFRGEVVLDIDDASGRTIVSVEYPTGTHSSKVLSDIRGWFEDGTRPEVPNNSYFRYSLTDAEAQETNDTLKGVGLELDAKNDTVSYSLSSLEDAFDYNKGEAEYIAARDEYVNALAKSIAEDKDNPTAEEIEKANRYLDGLFLVHDLIAADKDRLDYEAAVDKSAWVSNAEYGGSIDFSTLCAKRRLFTGTFDAIQEALPDTVLNENDFLRIRNMLLEKELESPCSMCYVEGSRAKHGEYVAKFLQEYLATNPEWKPQIADFTSSTRLEQTRINHPEAYQAYQTAMNKLAQRKPKEASVRTDYKGEILVAFEDGSSVEIKNKNGGIRFNSFSDFEIIHALDAMQVITDMARVGLNGQAYTKVKEFAECFGNTGLKINLSLVAKDVDANGKLIYDEVNGMKYAEAMDIRSRYSENVGSVLVVFNEDQLKAALADPEIDYVLPFHRSQWKKSQYAMMGLPVKTKDYTQVQNDRIRNPQTGRPVKLRKLKQTTTYTNDITGETFVIKDNIMPNQYWDFSKSGRENAQRYLDYINANGMTPKFDSVLEKVDGKWVLPEGAVGDGYYKLLIDFKMYDNDGWGAPQNPVVPEFNMPYIQQMLNDYKGGHKAFPVAHDVVDEFVQGKKNRQFSLTDEKDTYGRNGTSLRDLRVEGIAPVTRNVQNTAQESTASVQESTQDMFPDDYAPLSEDEGATEERLASLNESDVPPEMEAPYYGEDEASAPADPFEDRDIKEVGNRKVKAYMFENPEVKPFFQSEANIMLGELKRSTKGEKWFNGDLYYETNGEKGWGGTTRQTSDEIAYLLDELGYTYAEIEKGLNAIIEDDGAENNAISKRIEFLLHDRLSKGYTDFEIGYEIPANQDYVNLLAEKGIAEYNDEARQRFFDNADQYAPPMEEDIGPVVQSAPVTEEYEAIRPPRRQAAEPVPMDDDIAPIGDNVEYGDKLVRTDTERPGEKRRKWVGTSTESKPVKGKVLPDDLNQDTIHYQPISNKTTLGNANARLGDMGYDASLQYFNSQFANKKIGLDDIALGERLIQEAVKRGDTKTAGELIQNVAILGTELGQKVQALSIIKRLTPEGQLGMLKKVVERGKTKGDKAYDGVELTQEMIDKILAAYGKDGTYDQKKLNKAVEDVKQEIADQMKVTKMDKVNAWRYLSMLGNPKTHIRNVVSNIAMKGTVAVKNVLARTIETVAPIQNRTKTWRAASDEVKAFAKQTAISMKEDLTDGGKYNEDASIKAKRQIFKNKILNGMYEFNSEWLSKEDWWFSKSAFQNSLSEYLTANGIRTEADIEANPKIVEKAKQYAMEQSQIATFRQYSWLANKINDIERHNTATQMAVGAILPFKKTPINIAKTGLNYSPLGFAKTLTYDIAQVKNGKMEASELVDHLSQNITGSALTLVGYMLANAGLLSGGGEDDKEGEYDYQLGEQSYAINIGGKSYSLSWLSPAAMPMFIGANAYEQLVEGKEWNGDVVVETLAQTLDPLSEMSFLSGLNQVLSSYDSGLQKFAGIGESMVQNYVTQFVPTLSSQVATVMDDTKRSTKVAADSDFKFVDETINKLKLKIPGLRQTLEPSTDIWGNDIKLTDNTITKAFETFIAPYSVKENIATEIDAEIKDLYRQTGDTGIIPSIPYNYVNYKDEKYEMSAKDYTAFKKTYGQTAYHMMEDLFDTNMYQNASSAEKAELVNKVYDYARDLAKKNLLASRGVTYTNATSDGVEYYKENPIKGAIEKDMSVDEYNYSTKYPEKYNFLKDNGVSYSEFVSFDDDTKDAYEWAYKNPDKFKMAQAITDDFGEFYQYKKAMGEFDAKDAYGNSVSGLKKERVAAYISGLDLEYGRKLLLFKSQYPSDDSYNREIIEYLDSRSDISYEEMVTILTSLGFRVNGNTVTWD